MDNIEAVNYFELMSDDQDLKTDSKQHIIKTALKLFAALGLDKCSTREIAKQSDSNISLISYYFGGKEGLYKEVMRSFAVQMQESARPIVDEIQSHVLTKEKFIEDMRRVIEHIITTRVSNPEVSKIFSREKLAGLPYSREIHQEIFYPLILNFYELINQGKKNGIVKENLNPALLFIMITEGIWGFFEIMDCQTKISQDAQSIRDNPDELINQVLSLILTGVMK